MAENNSINGVMKQSFTKAVLNTVLNTTLLISVSQACAQTLAQPFLRHEFAGVDNANLHGYFSAGNATATHRPTVLALHGCGGMLNARGEPNARSESYAKLLNTQGWNVLFLDSFTGRGVKTVCGGGQAVTLAQRVGDVQAAVAWLGKRSDVDAQRMAILGWSHGGSTALAATAVGVIYAVRPKTTVVFYPGCGARSVQKLWQPAAPVLMQLGAADDWTDPKPCQTLAADWPALIAVDTYANAYHGFDSTAPLTQLKSIQSTLTGQGVHLGGEPAAKAASEKRIIGYLTESFK